MVYHQFRPSQTLGLALLLLTVPACTPSHGGNCNPCYFQKGANIAPLTNEAGMAKMTLDATTLESPLEFGTGSPSVEGCFVSASDLNGVSSLTATSIPTGISVKCQDKTSEHSFGVTLNLPDLRELGAGSYDLLATGGDWHFRGFSYSTNGDVQTDICSPPGTNASCTALEVKTATFGLVIDEAMGSTAPSPNNVSMDFTRTAHLQFDLDASATGHALVVNMTIPFTQNAKDYEGADSVTNGCLCD